MIVETEKYKERGKKLKEVRNINDLNTSGQYGLVVKNALHFFEEYGFDVAVSYYYAHGLRKTGMIDEAILVLKRLIKEQEQREIKGFYDDVRLELFKCYFMSDNYMEAYQLYGDIHHMLEKSKYYDSKTILLLLKAKLGMELDNTPEDLLFSQILKYNKEYALEHIKKHVVEYAEEDDVSIFADIDIENIFNLLQDILKNSKKLPIFSLRDAYLFYFPHVGRSGQSVLKVITNKGTNEIISMYPTCETGKNHVFINNNLFELYIQENCNDIKQLTQIEKFKNRSLKTKKLVNKIKG